MHNPVTRGANAPTPELLRTLRRIAGRRAAASHEADDIVQDVIMSAWAAGRLMDAPDFLPWAAGAIRLRARFLARSAARRSRREGLFALDDRCGPSFIPGISHEAIGALPPSLRDVASLASLGLGRREIIWLLRITDTALRQRIRQLRARIGADMSSTPPMGPRQGFGRHRRQVIVLMRRMPAGRRIATPDPDGHVFLVAAAHKTG